MVRDEFEINEVFVDPWPVVYRVLYAVVAANEAGYVRIIGDEPISFAWEKIAENFTIAFEKISRIQIRLFI